MSHALGIDNNMMLLAALSALDDVINQHLLIPVILLRQENLLRAVGNAAPEGDIAGMTAHNLDDAAALMAGGCITDLVDGFHGCINRRIEADGIVGAGDIQIDGSRNADGVDA